MNYKFFFAKNEAAAQCLRNSQQLTLLYILINNYTDYFYLSFLIFKLPADILFPFIYIQLTESNLIGSF